MEIVNCDLCGSNDSELLFCIPDYSLERFDVTARFVKCKNCGLVYQNPRPTNIEMEKNYPDSYEQYQTFSSPISKNKQRLFDYGNRKRAKTILKYKKTGTILDIGCSTGYFLSGMKSLGGWNVKGVEISRYAADLARSQYGIDVFQGTLEEAHFKDHEFDVVTMWDVLEHIYSPSETLLEIKRVLKPDGLLVFRIPNLDSWDAKIFGKYWAGYDSPRHLFAFRARNVRDLLMKYGFHFLDSQCTIGSYPALIISINFLLTGINGNKSFEKVILSILNHPIMKLIVGPFFYLYNFSKKGPSITIIAAPK